MQQHHHNMMTPQHQAHEQFSPNSDNMKVVIRVRPPLQRECVSGCEFRPVVKVGMDNKTCQIMQYLGAEVNEKERQRDID